MTPVTFSMFMMFIAGFLSAILLYPWIRPVYVRIKRNLNKCLIAKGVIRPGAKNRYEWVGDSAAAEMKKKFQIDFLKTHGLKPAHRLLDYGCGVLRGGVPIIEHLNSGGYTGLDIRPQVLEEARRELKESGLEAKQPRLVESKNAAQELAGVNFDVIWIFNVFIHMDDEVFRRELGFIAQHLAAGGICYGTVHPGARFDSEWQGFPFVTRPLWFYEQEVHRAGLDLRLLGTLDRFGYGAQSGKRSDLVMLEIRRP